MIDRLLDTPWKVTNFFEYLLSMPCTRFSFLLKRIPWGKGWKFYGRPILQKHRKSIMQFGSHLQLRSSSGSNPLGANHPVILCTWKPGATLIIGNRFGMTGGSIIAAESIFIGNNVTVGANTTIMDTDFHPLELAQRRINPQNARTAPIVIEDDVFIGMNCLVLKGVTIGKGSVIGAGSIVTKSIPAGVVASGNPAKVVRRIDNE